MYQFFVSPAQINIADKRVIIIGSDVNHIRNVLRMKPGEEIAVSNGLDGKEYRCGIISFEPGHVTCELRFVEEADTELPAKVYLFQALPKSDKMELIIQKAVELGVYQVIPVAAKRCVTRLEQKKAESKVARWQSIAEAAAKQSKRAIIPKVAEVMNFSQAVKLVTDMEVRLISYELAEGMDKTRELIQTLKPGQHIALFIGPEGGFEETEIREATENGIEPITLGKRILRTETAGMTVLSWIMCQLEGRS